MTTADDKQNQLQKEIVEIENRLLQLARGWVVDPDANVDREKRIAALEAERDRERQGRALLTEDYIRRRTEIDYATYTRYRDKLKMT